MSLVKKFQPLKCLSLSKHYFKFSILQCLQVNMLRRGLKEIGILNDEASYTYHQLNPTSIGYILLPIILNAPIHFFHPFGTYISTSNEIRGMKLRCKPPSQRAKL